MYEVAQARPRNKEVKLITEPRPGQEYVMFQSGATPRLIDAPEEARHGADFATSHRIPQRDRAVVEKEVLDIPRGPGDKVKRDSPLEELAAALILPADSLPLIPPSGSEEVRTEFSVVTSAPRRVVVEPKGGSGVLEGKVEGADEKKIMSKKAALIEQKPEEIVK